MTFEEFRNDIINKIDFRPSWSRKGQFVFNYIEETYGDVARHVQFVDNMDCFCVDDNIDSFIILCYRALKENNQI